MSTDITHQDVHHMAAALQGATEEVRIKTLLAEHLHEFLMELLERQRLDRPTHKIEELKESVAGLTKLLKKIAANTDMDLRTGSILENIQSLVEEMRDMVQSVVEGEGGTELTDAQSETGSHELQSVAGDDSASDSGSFSEYDDYEKQDVESD